MEQHSKHPANRARKHERFSVLAKVIIHNEEQIFIAPLDNISMGDLFVEKLISLELGNRVKVIVKSSHFTQPLQASGTIVRVETQDRVGSAVQFDWVQNDFEAILRKAIGLAESTGEQSS